MSELYVRDRFDALVNVLVFELKLLSVYFKQLLQNKPKMMQLDRS